MRRCCLHLKVSPALWKYLSDLFVCRSLGSRFGPLFLRTVGSNRILGPAISCMTPTASPILAACIFSESERLGMVSFALQSYHFCGNPHSQRSYRGD
jgi:hypothetical protein